MKARKRSVMVAILIIALAISVVLNGYLLAPRKETLETTSTTLTVSQTVNVIKSVSVTAISPTTVTQTDYLPPETTSVLNSTRGTELRLTLSDPQIVNYLPFPTILNVTIFSVRLAFESKLGCS